VQAAINSSALMQQTSANNDELWISNPLDDPQTSAQARRYQRALLEQENHDNKSC
jgi:hypothetical protein